MAPHLTAKELDYLQTLQCSGQVSIPELHSRLTARRRRQGLAAPHLTNVRKALKGVTYKRGLAETRGRKRVLRGTTLRKLDRARKTLQQKAAGEREVHWKDVLRAARVDVDPTTAARRMRDAGFDIQWRRPREKPIRSADVEATRAEVCGRWRRYPHAYFTDRIDLIMDNKRWEAPTHAAGTRYVQMQKVRGHLRTRGEGLQTGHTKPNSRKHRVNTGGQVHVCAGIIGCRVRLWHYLPKGRWNGEIAEQTYRGPIFRALKRYRGEKATYRVLEDNDPSGYKSRKAIDAKCELGITAMEFPKYSPDLNPMDFFLWDEIDRRMQGNAPAGRESRVDFMKRLRRTALSVPEAVIRHGVASMKKRAQAVYDAEGGNIARD